MRIARKCSYCGNLGHNSRTCNTSLSHKQHDHYNSSSSSLTLFGANENSDNYLGSGLISTIQDSKKGMPWTEEEHKIFLRGLEKLGKGNWRGISRYFVTTRTPTQVASHAQKYFLRHSHNSFINRTKHHSLLNLGCESKTRFETFYEPSEAFGTLSGINDLTANYISCISQLSGNRNFVSQLLSHAHSVLKWPNSSTSMNCTPLKVALDLELKLATPMPLELTEACSADPLS